VLTGKLEPVFLSMVKTKRRPLVVHRTRLMEPTFRENENSRSIPQNEIEINEFIPKRHLSPNVNSNASCGLPEPLKTILAGSPPVAQNCGVLKAGRAARAAG